MLVCVIFAINPAEQRSVCEWGRYRMMFMCMMWLFAVTQWLLVSDWLATPGIELQRPSNEAKCECIWSQSPKSCYCSTCFAQTSRPATTASGTRRSATKTSSLTCSRRRTLPSTGLSGFTRWAGGHVCQAWQSNSASLCSYMYFGKKPNSKTCCSNYSADVPRKGFRQGW